MVLGQRQQRSDAEWSPLPGRAAQQRRSGLMHFLGRTPIGHLALDVREGLGRGCSRRLDGGPQTFQLPPAVPQRRRRLLGRTPCTACACRRTCCSRAGAPSCSRTAPRLGCPTASTKTCADSARPPLGLGGPHLVRGARQFEPQPQRAHLHAGAAPPRESNDPATGMARPCNPSWRRQTSIANWRRWSPNRHRDRQTSAPVARS